MTTTFAAPAGALPRAARLVDEVHEPYPVPTGGLVRESLLADWVTGADGLPRLDYRFVLAPIEAGAAEAA